MKAITIQDFDKVNAQQKYRYLSLEDMSGAVIVPFNSAKISPSDRLKEIKTRMQAQPGNVIVIKGKTTASPKAKSDVYYIAKNPELLSEEPETIEIKAVEIPSRPAIDPGVNVRSYEYVLELEVKVKALELENEKLKDDIADLEDALSEAQGLADSAPQENPIFGWLKGTIEQSMPLVDKLLEQRDKRLALEEKKMNLMLNRMQQQPRPVPAPAPQPAPKQEFDTRAIELMVERIQSFVSELQESDPDGAAGFIQIYNSASDLDNFFNQVEQWDKDVFNSLVQYINQPA